MMKPVAASIRSIREYALAIVDGNDAADAFDRGTRRIGTPLWECVLDGALDNALFRHLYGDRFDPSRLPRGPAGWIGSFFSEQRGFVDASGMVKDLDQRYYAWLASRQRAWMIGCMECMIFCTLPGEHQMPQSPDVYLGCHPELAVPAVRALAILRLGELPAQTVGCLEMTAPEGNPLRRFLFFGLRSVE